MKCDEIFAVSADTSAPPSVQTPPSTVKVRSAPLAAIVTERSTSAVRAGRVGSCAMS